MRADACPLLQAEWRLLSQAHANITRQLFEDTFTPKIRLDVDLHCHCQRWRDVGGDVQQVPLVWSFTTSLLSIYRSYLARNKKYNHQGGSGRLDFYPPIQYYKS